MNPSREYFTAIDQVARRKPPVAVLERAWHSLLDYLAVTCAGAAFQGEKLKGYFSFAEPEKGMFKAIGTGRSLALKDAVFLNGLNGHALDFDDGTNSGIIHLGSPIFSLLLPLAQRHQTSVEKLLEAAIIGYEASYTMAVSIQPRHKALGYHATGTCGTLGATLAAAYMLDFPENEIYQAFAASCVAASGVLKVLDGSSELKPYNVAKTALLSLTSLQLAKAGFKGHGDPLGGARGFLKMMAGDGNATVSQPLLNGTYAIMKSYTKPYASCRYTHPPVEAAILLRKRHGIKAEDVQSIKVETYDLAVSGHDHAEVAGAYSAKMSTPYSVAVALAFGRVGLQEFGEAVLESKVITDLARKVHVVADDSLSKVFPEKQSAVVTIRTAGGEYSVRVDFPKGEPENPLTEDEFRERYGALMSFGNINKDVYASIYDMASQPERMASDLLQRL